MNNGSFVRIKGNSVELVTEHIERRVSLEDLFTQYSRRIGMASGMLPENCKMIITKRGRSIYVVEQKPCVREVVWRGMDGDRGKRVWRLEFPFCIFILTMTPEHYIGSAKIYYRGETLSSEDDKLYYGNICNVDGEGVICTGNLKVKADTPFERINQFTSKFWTSEFNTDLAGWYGDYARKFKEVRTLQDWETTTKEKPGFMIELLKNYDKYSHLKNQIKL